MENVHIYNGIRTYIVHDYVLAVHSALQVPLMLWESADCKYIFICQSFDVIKGGCVQLFDYFVIICMLNLSGTGSTAEFHDIGLGFRFQNSYFNRSTFSENRKLKMKLKVTPKTHLVYEVL